MQRRYSAIGLLQQIPPLHLLLSSIIFGAMAFIGLQHSGETEIPLGRIQVPLPQLGDRSGLPAFSAPSPQAQRTAPAPVSLGPAADARTDNRTVAPASSDSAFDAATAASASAEPSAASGHEYEVKPGDTLSAIFDRLGLSRETMQRLLLADENHLALGNLQPGELLLFELDDSGSLTRLQVKMTPANWLNFKQVGEGFEVENVTLKGEWRERASAGEINGSFYQSAVNNGLSPAHIQQIANLFQWKLNFKRDLRAGDRFQVLTAAEYIDGEFSGNSEIRAATIENRGHRYTAYLNDDGRYYDEQGQSMEQSFLRYPTRQRHALSSPFNPARRHPVTGRIQPHNGTDFAASVGTTVVATADGVVTKAGRHPLAGNYIEIKHGRKYKTRFLHLSKILVKPGQAVGRGQKIALSGNTGRSTGPHIHYELHINDRPVNAMRAKLPRAEGLTPEQLPEFELVKARYRRSFEQAGLQIAAR